MEGVSYKGLQILGQLHDSQGCSKDSLMLKRLLENNVMLCTNEEENTKKKVGDMIIDQ